MPTTDMYLEPNIASDEQDWQREAVYDATEHAREVTADWMRGEIDPIDRDALVPYVVDALVRAGWTEASSNPPPTFAFDVPDDSAYSAWYEAQADLIHLHPRLLSPWIVLHEVAHWAYDRGGHGPRFCGNFVSLIRAGMGDFYADELLASFEMHGVEVDANWLS